MLIFLLRIGVITSSKISPAAHCEKETEFTSASLKFQPNALARILCICYTIFGTFGAADDEDDDYDDDDDE